jgi:hypothetical protein
MRELASLISNADYPEKDLLNTLLKWYFNTAGEQQKGLKTLAPRMSQFA